MSKRILLRGARQLLTLRGRPGPRRGPLMRELGIIEDGAVLVVDGVIDDIGPSRRVENLASARDAVEIGAEGRVVMPGFVDCRTHLVSGPPLLDDFETQIVDPEGDGDDRGGEPPPSLSRAIACSSRKRLEMMARKVLKEFIRNGTTTLEARSGLGVDEKSELKILRALHALHRRPLDLEITFYGASSLHLDSGAAPLVPFAHILEKIRRRHLARFVDVRLGRADFPAEAALAYLMAARELGFLTKVTAAADTDARTVAEVAAQAGAVSVDYLDFAGAADVEIAARTNAIATLLPGTEFHRIRETYSPARALIDAGAAVAIASGYSSDASPTASMPAILAVACRRMRMSPAEAVTAATINGACALSCDRRTGSLEVGKNADIIMLNVSDYREIPYRFGMNHVTMIMKRGDVIYPRMEFPWMPS